ncbi:hypothetical protein [Paraburkholderia mimosarum]|uniref:hypothetical protein n=1 Tax=Paraburkholderia mimosarum TaxID=312026 RepID=UPI00056AD8F1|nr:hypothetical protein [Paraburkholderia mimosarum]
MKHIIMESPEAGAEGSVAGTEPRSGADVASRSAAPQSPSNWAWASATGQYDWMDNYAPFVTLD